jgi:hypothetical protein
MNNKKIKIKKSTSKQNKLNSSKLKKEF